MTEERTVYLFRENGGTVTSNWFVIGRDPESYSENFSCADSAVRRLWVLQGGGYNIIDVGVPIEDFEKSYERVYRELNEDDREELGIAERELKRIFGSREQYLAKLRNVTKNS